jgi:hypothetical protein
MDLKTKPWPIPKTVAQRICSAHNVALPLATAKGSGCAGPPDFQPLSRERAFSEDPKGEA